MMGKSRRAAIKDGVAWAAATLFWCGASGCGGGASKPARNEPDVRSVVEEVRAQSGVPALAGAYITASEIKHWASGNREVGQSGSANTVTPEDLFQVNSNLKAVTSTLAARLVEQGRIRFDSTPGEIFGQFAAEMNPSLRDVTLEQLLNHRAGVASLLTLDEIEDFGGLRFDGSPRQQRLAFARVALGAQPSAPVGSFRYSNGGYAVAGAMLEAAANEEFAALLQQEVFAPLGGVYRPGYPRETDPQQPVGHANDSPITALDAAPLTPPSLEPAGVGSVSTRDFARFVQTHLRGARGETSLLPGETIRLLHTAQPTGQPGELGDEQRYAFGWEEVTLSGVRTLVHYGSDDTYFSVVVIQPTRDAAAYVVTNIGGERGYNAVNEAATRLLGIPNPFASRGRARTQTAAQVAPRR